MENFIYEFANFIKNIFDTQSFNPNFTNEILDYIYEEDSKNAYLYDKLYFEFLITKNMSFNDYCNLDREKIIEYALLILAKENNKV